MSDSATPWTVAHQAPLSMGFFRQEYWSELPCPPPGNLPDPGNEPTFPALQVGSLLLSHLGSPMPTLGMEKLRLWEIKSGAKLVQQERVQPGSNSRVPCGACMVSSVGHRCLIEKVGQMLH